MKKWESAYRLLWNRAEGEESTRLHLVVRDGVPALFTEQGLKVGGVRNIQVAGGIDSPMVATVELLLCREERSDG